MDYKEMLSFVDKMLKTGKRIKRDAAYEYLKKKAEEHKTVRFLVKLPMEVCYEDYERYMHTMECIEAEGKKVIYPTPLDCCLFVSTNEEKTFQNYCMGTSCFANEVAFAKLQDYLGRPYGGCERIERAKWDWVIIDGYDGDAEEVPFNIQHTKEPYFAGMVREEEQVFFDTTDFFELDAFDGDLPSAALNKLLKKAMPEERKEFFFKYFERSEYGDTIEDVIGSDAFLSNIYGNIRVISARSSDPRRKISVFYIRRNY